MFNLYKLAAEECAHMMRVKCANESDLYTDIFYCIRECGNLSPSINRTFLGKAIVCPISRVILDPIVRRIACGASTTRSTTLLV